MLYTEAVLGCAALAVFWFVSGKVRGALPQSLA
jgi:hypothetical protein